MKISLLIKREPFSRIFEKTLGNFLLEYSSTSHRVNWLKKKSLINKNELIQIWYCYPLINSIFVKDANIKVFENISSEYSINPIRPWRSKLQKLFMILYQKDA